MNQFLKEKKILFIALEDEYGYHLSIINALKQVGSIVTFFPIEKKNFIYILYRTLSKSLFLLRAKKHANFILKKIETQRFDYIFVIHGFQLPVFFYEKLRKNNPNAIFINYTWDSIRKTPFKQGLMDILIYFDRAFSFDRGDCEQYKRQKYLPLFYSPSFNRIEFDKCNFKYDIIFIGSLNTDLRYNLIQKIKKICKKENIRFYYYLRVAYPYFFKSIFKLKFMWDVRFKPISTKQIVELYKKSNTVIDLPGQIQTGLTMRTIETIAIGKKLITTNENIKKERFYNPDYINVIDKNNPVIDINFINKNINNNINVDNYSIYFWLMKLFNNE